MLKFARVVPTSNDSCSSEGGPGFPSPDVHPMMSSSRSVTFEESPRGATRNSLYSAASSQSLREEGDDGEGIRRRRRPRGMFADADELKNKVLENMMKKKNADFYLTSGLFQLIARSSYFDHCTLFLIAVNAIWIGIETDSNGADVLLNAGLHFQVVEHFFCLYFTIELYIRLMAFKRTRDCIRDPWMAFDSVLVLLMVSETWVMTTALLVTGSCGEIGMKQASVLRVARLLRLTRMGRMVRLLRVVPELTILVKAMATAARSVLFTFCLLVIAIYLYSIALVQLTRGSLSGKTYFCNVPRGMYTLMVYGTLMDEINSIMAILLEDSFLNWLIYLSFILIAALTVMNLLIGMLCQVVQAVASTEKEQLQMDFVKGRIEGLFQIKNMSLKAINRDAFVEMLRSTETTNALQDVGVDPVALVDFADVIFDPDNDGTEDQDISFEKLMEVVLDLRGSNTARVKDIVEMRKAFRGETKRQEATLQRFEDKLCRGAQASGRGLSRSGSRVFSRQQSSMLCQGISPEGEFAQEPQKSLPRGQVENMFDIASIATEHVGCTIGGRSPRCLAWVASNEDRHSVGQLSQLCAQMDRLESLLQQDADRGLKQEFELECVGKQVQQLEGLLNQLVSRLPPPLGSSPP